MGSIYIPTSPCKQHLPYAILKTQRRPIAAMGICCSTKISEDEEKGYRSTIGCQKIQNGNKIQEKRCEFSKEQANLDALLGSIRTGLVISETEFSCLPASINTTSRITFRVSSNRVNAKIAKPDPQASNMEGGEEEEEEEEQEEVEENQDEEKDLGRGKKEISQNARNTVVVSLKGHGWVKSLTMCLDILPVFGPFAGKELCFRWSDDTLKLIGGSNYQLNAKKLPISFETEAEFCKCCLLLTYMESRLSDDRDTFGEDADANLVENCEFSDVTRLSFSAYKVAVANLDAVDTCGQIPAKLTHKLFGLHDPIDVSLAIWPKNASVKNTSSMKVKFGILFAELSWLIKQHLGLKPQQIIKLYNNFKMVNSEDTVTQKLKHLDCFAVPLDENETYDLDYCDSIVEDIPASGHTNIVMSLVGDCIKEVAADLQTPMKKLDMNVREEFKLGKDSFLIILAEDDLMPQYMADDNWKCTYSFSIPDKSLGRNLRRSFRQLSRRREMVRSESGIATASDNNLILPHMREVIRLLSSSSRQFPQNTSKRKLSVEELYTSWSFYQMTAEQCGIHTYSMVRVFEVTGPSIPITIRVLFDHDTKAQPLATPKQRLSSPTKLANIIDINPAWSITTFLQYIDAVISLSSSLHQRRLWLRESMMGSEENDLDKLKLGELLDSWKPAWWTEKFKQKGQLVVKDIDPAEYLVVEKY